MTFADRLEELVNRNAQTPFGIAEKLLLLEFFLANNADAILELVRAAEEIPEILRNWEPDYSSGLERKKIVAFQSALAKLNKDAQAE